MKFAVSTGPEEGLGNLVAVIRNALENDQTVLWLVSGGSNVPIAVTIMEQLSEQVPKKSLSRLAVTLTDERYGEPGHADSNWQQLIEAGFDFRGITVIPVLCGQGFEETARAFEVHFKKALSNADMCIAQLGIGPDAHIAGILPHSNALNTDQFVSAYVSKPCRRITLTLAALKNVDATYGFVFGESKRAALQSLKKSGGKTDEKPARFLLHLRNVTIYTDLTGLE